MKSSSRVFCLKKITSIIFLITLSTFLIQLNGARAEDRNELLFYLEKSDGIQWKNPAKLFNTTIKASIGKAKYPIGHVTMGVRCGNKEVHTGITQRYVNESKDVVKKEKQGLGTLFHTFAGLLENQKRIDFFVRTSSVDNRFAILKVKLSSESCERALHYVDTITRNNLGPYYGFLARPLEGEGGGCSAYAASFLDVTGIKESWMIDSWTRHLLVPMDSIGGPLNGWKKVRVLKQLLGGGEKSWAEPHEEHLELFFWDPDLMVEWIQKTVQTANTDPLALEKNRARVIPVTKSLYPTSALSRPFEISPEVVAIELDRSDIKPPQEINYKTTPNDPRRAVFSAPFSDDERLLQTLPDFRERLKTWWGEDQAYSRKKMGLAPAAN